MNITLSEREGKRYKAVFPTKTVHFGAKTGSTYIDHGDKVKRSNYIKRHKANEDWTDPYSAGALSRWLLWGPHTSLKENIKAYKRRFKLL